MHRNVQMLCTVHVHFGNIKTSSEVYSPRAVLAQRIRQRHNVYVMFTLEICRPWDRSCPPGPCPRRTAPRCQRWGTSRRRNGPAETSGLKGEVKVVIILPCCSVRNVPSKKRSSRNIWTRGEKEKSSLFCHAAPCEKNAWIFENKFILNLRKMSTDFFPIEIEFDLAWKYEQKCLSLFWAFS